VGVCHVLMSVDHPSPEVIAAVDAAVAWFKKVQINGIRVDMVRVPEGPRKMDRVVSEDPTAGPIWSRYYEIGTDKPIFCGRDSIIRYKLAEVEIERRAGYNWYGVYPKKLIEEEYPKWRKQVQP